MAGLTLDAGALIAADRDDRGFWAYWSEAVAREVVAVIPAPALAQAWRKPTQVRLARLVNACSVEPLDERLAKAAGELCARSGLPDAIDASVVVSAAQRGDAVLTTDPDDLRQLASLTSGVTIVEI